MAFYDPVTKICHGIEVPQIYHPNASLGQVLIWNFFRRPEKVIQVSDDDGISVTCSEMAEMMKNIAQNLVKLELKLGDTAGLFATNTTYVAPAIFGCYLLGLPISPLDVSFNVSQIVQIYRETKPKIIFSDHSVAEKLVRALEELESDSRIVIMTEKLDGFLHISDLIKAPTEPVHLSLDLGSSEEVVCAILCTSGSSGMPKLARISHAQYLLPFTMNPFREETFALNFSSLYWLTGFSNIIFQTLNFHKRLITSKPFSPDLCCDLIEKYKLKNVFLLPPHITLLVNSPRFHTTDFSSLNSLSSGGLMLTQQMRQTLKNKIPNAAITVALGMTEVGGIISKTSPGDPFTSSVGKPVVNTQVKILIDDGTVGGINEIGEILVKKPAKFLGYVSPRHPTILDADGWIRTGDMGFIDDNLEVNIVGQRSFIIKNFYNEMYPNEIEEVVQRLNGVEQSCVVGVPDTIEIEVPSIFVVKSANSNITKDEIIQATNHFPSFKRVREVIFVDNLPMSPSGKVQRKMVKEMAEEMKIISVNNRPRNE